MRSFIRGFARVTKETTGGALGAWTYWSRKMTIKERSDIEEEGEKAGVEQATAYEAWCSGKEHK